MIAHRRADVADLNRRARERMRAAGRLGLDELVSRTSAPSPSVTASSPPATTAGSASSTATSGTLTWIATAR